MIIPAEKLAGQNSAYRHRNMKGAFGNEGALLPFARQQPLLLLVKGFSENLNMPRGGPAFQAK